MSNDYDYSKALLVEINTYAEGHYSEAEYNEVIFVTKEDFLKHFASAKMDVEPLELTAEALKSVEESEVICIPELDGKYSEVYGDIECDDWDADRIRNYYENTCNDGDRLKNYLTEHYTNLNNYEQEKQFWEELEQHVKEVVNKIEPLVSVTVKVPKNKVDELRKFAEQLAKHEESAG